jgi:hypothetical protein
MSNGTNVIDFQPKRKVPSFTISAVQDSAKGWVVSINEFYDYSLTPAQAMREIADAMVVMAGGMIAAAESKEPTNQGRMIAAVSFYEGGHIELQSEPLDSKAKWDWLIAALETARKQFSKKKNRKP